MKEGKVALGNDRGKWREGGKKSLMTYGERKLRRNEWGKKENCERIKRISDWERDGR